MLRRRIMAGNGVEFVDLGLPSGTLWADRNIGASSISDYGKYFSWGNVEGHTPGDGYSFDEITYGSTPGSEIYYMSPEHDAAAVNLPGSMICTTEQWNELIQNCTITLDTVNGVSGQRFTSKNNSNSIFIPFSGYCLPNISADGQMFMFWSCYRNNNDNPYVPGGQSNYTSAENAPRYMGLPVRAVLDNRIISTPNLIDLGLPSGTKWADRNIGASDESGNGLFFAWGETQGYVNDTQRKMYFGKSSGFSLNTYNFSGATAITSDLTSSNDAATVLFGGNWRMPTKAECEELLSNCNSTIETINGMTGRRYTSKINGNSVFFPFTKCDGTAQWYTYLTSQIYGGAVNSCWGLNVEESNVVGVYRYCGESIRAVQ